MAFFVSAFLLLIANISIFSVETQARPVSYPGGWTLMLENDNDSNSSHIHYSPTAKFSLGWRHDYLRESGAHIDTLQLNNLLKRWNKPNQQANIYLKSGLGVTTDNAKLTPTAFTGMALDWETRRYFTSYENRFLWSDNSEKFAKHTARVGITPYIGDFGDIHTWLMIETEYTPAQSDSFSVTPLIRFFKGSTLLEGGYNLDNGIEFNLIQRF